MVDILINIFSAVLGTIGFCFMLRVRKHRLPSIAISTAVCYSCYLLVYHFTQTDFISITTASIVAAISAELLARFLKAPVTIFLIPTILPLVPGAKLYYTIESFFQGEMRVAMGFFSGLGRDIGAILIGIILVSTISKCIKNAKKNG